VLLAKESTNQRWVGLAYGGPGALGNTLYIADNALGIVWQIRLRDRAVQPFIMGLDTPTAIGILLVGDILYVVCGAGREVLAFQPTQPVDDQELGDKSPSKGPATQHLIPEQSPTPFANASETLPPTATTPPRSTTATSPVTDALPTRSPRDQEKSLPTFHLSQKTDSWLLLAESPRNRFIADLEVTCLKPGTILDTVGINAAPRGSVSLWVGPDGKVYFHIYDPKAKSSVKMANGWHVVASTRRLQ